MHLFPWQKDMNHGREEEMKKEVEEEAGVDSGEEEGEVEGGTETTLDLIGYDFQMYTY